MFNDSETHVPLPSDDTDDPSGRFEDAEADEDGSDPDLNDVVTADSIDEIDRGD
jgi:hypothetical protein